MTEYDDWESLPWQNWEAEIYRLQHRIFHASETGDRRRTHRLQRLLLASKAARYFAVRKVTQINRGKHAAGVDGIRSLSNQQRMELVESLDLEPTGTPLRRVWIDKPGKPEKRSLSIPIIRDRCQQVLVKLALEPEWEARFEVNSYGFRPGRCAADAMGAVRNAIDKQDEGKYVLDCDVRGCFDNIDHGSLLSKLGTIRPIHQLIRSWLKSGVLDAGRLHATKRGVPQGSVIGPLLANITLHGIEEAVVACLPARPTINGKTVAWRPHLVRYADDFLIVHRDLKALETCGEAARKFLAEYGLEFNAAKTIVRHTVNEHDGNKPGIDFLGFNIRSYTVGKHQRPGGGRPFTTLIKPSKNSVKRHLAHLREIIQQSKAADQDDLINLLNPVIVGWSNYYKVGNSAETFGTLDHLVFQKLRRWGKRRHSSKTSGYVIRKYWNGGRKPWKFTGGYGAPILAKHSDTKIVPHIKVRGAVSWFNGDKGYWSRKKRIPVRLVPKPSEHREEEVEGDSPDLWT